MVGIHNLVVGNIMVDIRNLVAGSIKEGNFSRLVVHLDLDVGNLADNIAVGILIAIGVEVIVGHLEDNNIWNVGLVLDGVVVDIDVEDVGWDEVAGRVEEEEYLLVVALVGEFVELHLDYSGAEDLAEDNSIEEDIVHVDAAESEYGLQECCEQHLAVYFDGSVSELD
jgi:hypothetical protein